MGQPVIAIAEPKQNLGAQAEYIVLSQEQVVANSLQYQFISILATSCGPSPRHAPSPAPRRKLAQPTGEFTSLPT